MTKRSPAAFIKDEFHVKNKVYGFHAFKYVEDLRNAGVPDKHIESASISGNNMKHKPKNSENETEIDPSYRRRQ